MTGPLFRGMWSRVEVLSFYLHPGPVFPDSYTQGPAAGRAVLVSALIPRAGSQPHPLPTATDN